MNGLLRCTNYKWIESAIIGGTDPCARVAYTWRREPPPLSTLVMITFLASSLMIVPVRYC